MGSCLVGCGSSGGTGIEPSAVGSQARLTFNGALTRSFSGTQGEMEFNIALLQGGDPPQPITQLSASQVSLQVNRVTDLLGIPQPVALTLTPTRIENPPPDLPQRPLLMAVLMDGSGSLLVLDPQSRRFLAVFRLLDQFRPALLDLGAILRFDNRGAGFGVTALGQPLRTAQLLQDFTSDRELLRRGVLRAVPGGNTALYDATVEAGRFLSDFRPTERFNRRLVVFTDGIDNESTRSINQATQELTTLARERGQKLTVYVVGLGVDLNLLELQRLAAATEGTFVLARFSEGLEAPFANLFPAAIGEHRLQMRVQSNVPLSAGSYLLSGELRVEREGSRFVAPFSDAVLTVGSR
ncbi:vWA domain-containing protein [Synechococcus sp. R55.8]|uniref:vWA domain-containing protein n=1 Tax=Synechococcus sp. R55.8 TaxID=2964501 RepID=UPI0039C1D839